MRHESLLAVESESVPGVRFTIRRMSFGRRNELLRRVRELTRKVEFLEAGKTPAEKLEAALAGREADQAYLEWGLAGVQGLEIDGEAATPRSLIESGPEGLCQEILRAIQRECGLTADERKN
ncbi:MAG: hypothetical protein HY822_19375 [Acidobacteria bacterium]|nr:hypothetical protein [Acidobacteriota bacterium]